MGLVFRGQFFGELDIYRCVKNQKDNKCLYDVL